MIAFVDTSAFVAVLDRDDRHHASARRKWEALIKGQAVLVVTNYVLVETIALVQSRLGLDALRVLCEDILPLLHVEWVEEQTHRAGMAGLFTASKRRLSLVDCVSFEVMRRLGITNTFAFDRHFREQGFEDVAV